MRTRYKCFYIAPEPLQVNIDLEDGEYHLYRIIKGNKLSVDPVQLAGFWNKYRGTVSYNAYASGFRALTDFGRNCFDFFKTYSSSFRLSWCSEEGANLIEAEQRVRRFMSCPLFITKLASLGLYEEERNMNFNENQL